jgi:uncharacterized protein Yka (UPF0111/DUF47 family)
MTNFLSGVIILSIVNTSLWKDIQERLEDVSDKCDDIANVLEAIVLKHA